MIYEDTFFEFDARSIAYGKRLYKARALGIDSEMGIFGDIYQYPLCGYELDE